MMLTKLNSLSSRIRVKTKGGQCLNKVQNSSLSGNGSRRLNHYRRWLRGMANRYCSRKVCRNIGSYDSCGNNGMSACLCSHLRRDVLVANNLKTTILHKDNQKPTKFIFAINYLLIMMDILKYSLNLSNVIEVYDPFINGALSGLKSFIEGIP